MTIELRGCLHLRQCAKEGTSEEGMLMEGTRTSLLRRTKVKPDLAHDALGCRKSYRHLDLFSPITTVKEGKQGTSCCTRHSATLCEFRGMLITFLRETNNRVAGLPCKAVEEAALQNLHLHRLRETGTGMKTMNAGPTEMTEDQTVMDTRGEGDVTAKEVEDVAAGAIVQNTEEMIPVRTLMMMILKCPDVSSILNFPLRGTLSH